MSDIDTMRWGDAQTLNFANAMPNPSGAENFLLPSKQMLNAHWQRPLLWKLMISVTPQVDDSVMEGFAFSLTAFLYVGVGQANSLVPLDIFNFSGVPPYTPVTKFYDIPAENYQLLFQLMYPFGTSLTQSYVLVSAFTAPFTEPRMVTDVREYVGRGRDLPRRADAGSDEQPRYFPPGFEDGQMTYRR